MKIHLIAVGTRMPDWVTTGFNEYAKRLPPECALQLHEVNAAKRGKSAAIDKIIQTEGQAILAKIPKHAFVIALDEAGQSWSTQKLANQLNTWLQAGQDIALLVGGPEGLSDQCKAQAKQHWSLSPLTLPHPMVRVLIAEALYRAWSLLNNHPYHRA